MPMTVLEISPSAPLLSPFSGARFAGSTINATLSPSRHRASCADQNVTNTTVRILHALGCGVSRDHAVSTSKWLITLAACGVRRRVAYDAASHSLRQRQ